MSGIRYPQLFDDVGHMKLDGAGFYAQDHRRFLVGFTHAGPIKDLVFPVGKAGISLQGYGVFF